MIIIALENQLKPPLKKQNDCKDKFSIWEESEKENERKSLFIAVLTLLLRIAWVVWIIFRHPPPIVGRFLTTTDGEVNNPCSSNSILGNIPKCILIIQRGFVSILIAICVERVYRAGKYSNVSNLPLSVLLGTKVGSCSLSFPLLFLGWRGEKGEGWVEFKIGCKLTL